MAKPNGRVLKHLYQYRIEIPAWGVILTNHAEFILARLQEMWPGIEATVSGQETSEVHNDAERI